MRLLTKHYKGKEIKMPEGLDFQDAEGTKRKELRIKWWEDPTKMTYKSISVEAIDNLPDIRVETNKLKSLDYYPENDKTVFFGHYWLSGEPALCKQNICCLDYSVAKKGKLVAYRHTGEKPLDSASLIYV